MIKFAKVLLFAAFFLISGRLYSQNVDSNFVDGSVYLKLEDTSTLQLTPYLYTNASLNLLFADYGVVITKIRQPFPDKTLSSPLAQTFQLRFKDSARIDSLISDLKKLKFIAYAEKEPLIKLHYTPNDLHSKQWHLYKIKAEEAWNLSKGSVNVVVAIVDNGVRVSHSDLKANIWVNPGEIAGNLLDDDLNGYADDVNGYDVADGDNNPSPPASTTDSGPFNHGTHCAGIASAVSNNGNGIASIGFNTKIMAVKCTPNSSTEATLTNAYDGIYYAIRAKANIISMSFGTDQSSITWQNLMSLANSSGITLVASAGNSNSNKSLYPAAYSNVIAVAATDASDVKASYSNYGSWVDVSAPGNSIYSTLAGTDNSYGNLGGTSMSAPLVAGLAALLKAQNSSYTPAQIEAALKKGCDPIDVINPTYTGQLGAGRINAYKALNPSSGSVLIGLNKPISLFPIPVNNLLTLTLGSGYDHVSEIRIVNAIGEPQLVNFEKVGSDYRMDVSALSSGIYFLHVKTPSTEKFQRFQKL